MQLVRVTGGLTEVLEAPGVPGLQTNLNEPFTVPDDVGTALLADGTARFQAVA